MAGEPQTAFGFAPEFRHGGVDRAGLNSATLDLASFVAMVFSFNLPNDASV